MTKTRLLNGTLVLLVAATLCACGSGNLPTPTQPAATSTPKPALSGAAIPIPSVVIPGMLSKMPQQVLRQASPRARNLPDDSLLGPPQWVKAGTRITFYEAAASVAESSFAWVEDPSGGWTDPVTGKHYRRTDQSGEAMPTASGDGLSQIDVLAVEGSDVVLSTSLYGIDHINNQFVPGGVTGAKMPGATVDGAWINPTELAQLQQAQLSGVLILRGDYALNGTTYQAISFANTTPGAYQSYTYDTVTGLLLSATTSTAGATSPVTAQGEAPPQGNTQLTITRLAGYRQRSVPGVTGRNPDWLAQTSELRYSGTYNFTNPVDPASANLTFPMDVTVSFGDAGQNWASYTSQSYVQYPGSQPSTGSGVTGTTGLYWLDQIALGSLSAGQLLDQDPWTGEQLAVDSVDSGAVTISSQIQGISTTTQYDQSSGMLTGYAAHIAGSGTTIQLQLQGRP